MDLCEMRSDFPSPGILANTGKSSDDVLTLKVFSCLADHTWASTCSLDFSCSCWLWSGCRLDFSADVVALMNLLREFQVNYWYVLPAAFVCCIGLIVLLGWVVLREKGGWEDWEEHLFRLQYWLRLIEDHEYADPEDNEKKALQYLRHWNASLCWPEEGRWGIYLECGKQNQIGN